MKLQLTTLFIFLSYFSMSQLTITNDGKKVEEITCDMNNLGMSMPLPKNYASYEKIKVTIGQYRPDGGFLFDYVYDIEFNSVYFEGKDKIDLKLLDAEGKSDLYKGWYIYYTVSKPCVDGNRDYTKLENIVHIYGGTHNGWEYVDDKKVKTYSYESLSKYSIDHIIGAVTNDFYGPEQAFVIGKFAKGETDVNNYEDVQYVEFTSEVNDGSGNDVMDMGGPAPSAKVGKIYMASQVFKTEETSVKDIKKGLEFLLIRLANPNFTVNGTNIPFDHCHNYNIDHFYPAVIGGTKKDEGSSNSETGGAMGKFKKFTGSISSGSGGNSGPSKDEARADIEKMIANSGEYFTWETKNMGGVSVTYIELDVYEKDQMKSYDSGAKHVKDDQKGQTKKLRFYLAEKDGKSVAIALYKSLTPGLTDVEKEFMQNFDSTFKWNS